MNLKEFSITCDTVIISIVIILIFLFCVTYKLGFDNGKKTEKIEWLEQKQLDNIKEIKNER
jgi:predicted RND superfamily exporter protein